MLSNYKSGEVTRLEVNKNTKMQVIIDRYCRKKGLGLGTVRFLLDGERIRGDDKLKALELDNEEQIDAVTQQSGGS